MNKRIQKKMLKKLFTTDQEKWSRTELRYFCMFLARKRSMNNEYRRRYEQARLKVEQEIKERQDVSNERTKAIVDKLVDVEVKIREVFENV